MLCGACLRLENPLSTAGHSVRVIIAIFVLGLLFQWPLPAYPRSPDASAAVTNARPGHVRHVSGNPAVLGAGPPQSEPLQAGRRLKRGERVHTRTDDRVEIVLSANSYLRLGGKARVEVLSDDYPAMDVGLLEGEAVVDSEGTGGKHHVFSVSTSAGRPAGGSSRLLPDPGPPGTTGRSHGLLRAVVLAGSRGPAIRVEPAQALLTGPLGGDSLRQTHGQV